MKIGVVSCISGIISTLAADSRGVLHAERARRRVLSVSVAGFSLSLPPSDAETKKRLNKSSHTHKII